MSKLSTDWNERLENSSYDLEEYLISKNILNIYLGNTRNLLLKTKHFS